MTNVVSLGPWLHVIRRDAMYDSQEVFVSYTQFLCLESGFIFICNIKKCCFFSPSGIFENSEEPELHHRCRQSHPEWLCVGPNHPEMSIVQTPSPDVSGYHHYHYTPKCFLTIHRGE